MASCVYTVFIENLQLPFRLGILPHEQRSLQPVRFDVSVTLQAPHLPTQYEDCLCYKTLSEAIADLAQQPWGLVESLADQVATLALAHPHSRQVTVKVCKPTALAAAQGVGVQLTREKDDDAVI